MNRFDTLQASQVKQEATWIELDRNALLYNLAQVIGLTFPGADILAVVKANAYGHGLLEVAPCLKDHVAYFGVASIDEALRLRNFEIDTPILLFGVPLGGAIEAAIQAEISLAVSSTGQARDISEAAQRLKKRAVIHVKIDTGMGRLGIPQATAEKEICEIASLDMLEIEGVFTHFPQGENETDPFTLEQVHSFYRILERVAKKGIHFTCRHAAGSIGIANYKSSHFNLVRPGITLYGLYPCQSLRSKLNLKPVLSWRARIILLKRLGPGESAGYGRTFKAEEEITVGIVPAGYSHGYPFSLSNKGTVIFRGRPYQVAGRVSMDYLAVNLGPHVQEARIGEIVTLLGRDGDYEIGAETLAQQAGTIPYEIVTQLNPNIPRIIV